MTRHNIGFMVVDRLAEKLDAGLKEISKLEGEVGKSGDVVLLKPTTFMNLSGQSVQKVCHYYKIALEDILVICDDAALQFGDLRMREKGTSGGHNGLQDIIDVAGYDFARLKIGIGGPGQLDLADYVLANFRESECEELPKIIEEATNVCETWLQKGFQKAATAAATKDQAK